MVDAPEVLGGAAAQPDAFSAGAGKWKQQALTPGLADYRSDCSHQFHAVPSVGVALEAGQDLRGSGGEGRRGRIFHDFVQKLHLHSPRT